MKKILLKSTNTNPIGNGLHLPLLIFRVLLSLELIYVHGLKKLGIDGGVAESIPNPLNLPEFINNSFAISANLFFPVLIILGLFTRLASLPILAVTLTGYFIMHFNDGPLVKDIPFMYSISYLLILSLGAGKYSLDHKFFNK